MSLRREKVGKTVARLAAKINIIACLGRSDERCRIFSANFRRFLKIAEDCRRLARKTRRCYEHTPTNLSTNLIFVKSSISIKNTPLESRM